MFLLFLTPIFSVFALTFGRTYLEWAKKNHCTIAKTPPLNPDNSLIIFDLHGVLFKHDFAKMIKTFWASPQKWHLLWDLLDLCLIWDILKLAYRRPVPESFFMHLAHNHAQIKDVLPLLIRIANCQKRNEPMINLVKTLKQEGFQLAVISNIGQRIYNDLEPQHRDLFSLFDSITVASPETDYVSKPNPKMYELFLNTIGNSTKHMVLIDDKQKNLCGALPFGVIGIRFSSIAQCTKKFKQLGILP